MRARIGPIWVAWLLVAACGGEEATPSSGATTAGTTGGSTATSSDTSSAPNTSATSPTTTPPTVSAAADVEAGVAPLLVRFDATVTDGAAPVRVAWEFGDGTRAAADDPAHTYTAPATTSPRSRSPTSTATPTRPPS